MVRRPPRLRHEVYGCLREVSSVVRGLCRRLILAASPLWLLLGLGDDGPAASRHHSEHLVAHLLLSSPPLSDLLCCCDGERMLW